MYVVSLTSKITKYLLFKDVHLLYSKISRTINHLFICSFWQVKMKICFVPKCFPYIIWCAFACKPPQAIKTAVVRGLQNYIYTQKSIHIWHQKKEHSLESSFTFITVIYSFFTQTITVDWPLTEGKKRSVQQISHCFCPRFCPRST